MRQLVALCFIALIGSSWAVSIAESSEIPSMKVTTVPRGILAQIAARIAADGPLDDIFGLFKTLEQTIRQEQVTHDTLSARQGVECKAERAFRNKEIAEAGSALQRATDSLNSCKTSRHQARIELRTNLKTQQDVGAHLGSITETRNTEKENYNRRQAGINSAISAIDEGLRILNEAYEGAASLVEVAKSAARMFQAGMDIGKAHHFGPVISALAQVAQKPDFLINKNVLGRVQDLFKIARERLVNSQKKNADHEAKAVSRFEEFSGKLKKQIEGLKKREKKIRSGLLKLEECILKSENIITLATAKKERNTSLLKSADKMCKNFEAEYKTATAARKEELALVDRMKTVVSKKTKKFSAEVKKRGKEDQFKKYENKATIAGPSTWKKAENKDDALGAKQSGFKADDKLAAIQK